MAEITTVQALIINPSTKQILMAFRKSHKMKPDMWEYPGGKVDPGEKLRDAIKRELKEELDIDAVIGEIVAKTVFHWRDTMITFLYAVESYTGTPKNLESQKLGWFEHDYANDRMPCLPHVYATYDEVADHLRRMK